MSLIDTLFARLGYQPKSLVLPQTVEKADSREAIAQDPLSQAYASVNAQFGIRHLVRAVGVTPATVPEAAVTAALAVDLALQGVTPAALHIDRAYLSSHLVRERPADWAISCKAWPVRNGDRFPKTALQLDWETGTIRCPHEVVVPFPPEACAACPLPSQCTTGQQRRSVSIHPDAHVLAELRERQTTTVGRATLRERVAVEHSLAQVGQWQGRGARYRGCARTSVICGGSPSSTTCM